MENTLYEVRYMEQNSSRKKKTISFYTCFQKENEAIPSLSMIMI